ncbi:type VI secretion system baseplate subunit TssE [Oceaniglobus roseus]|uniref:type VI secretion system baseplate subunit TssE n=1 Tax=Oceaniglobus roseus TaxID=1737570 RepID=UPI000C7F3982|nr:type VI secretion system baseplate subunit TssE [Kandeliimicrobium roseum]
MADRTITERLQPSLLDRLTDHEPDKATESRDRRVIDINRLRDIVRRDLSWLLNANNLETELDPEAYPHTTESVLNYGVRDVSGLHSTEERAHLIRRSMQQAIRRFEPRLNEGTLDIVQRKDAAKKVGIVSFDIVADMWAEPIPLELYLRSEIDVTTGEIQLEAEG